MPELGKKDTNTTEISTVLGDNYLIKKSNILILAKFPPMNVFEYKLMGIATSKLTVQDLRNDGFSKVMIHSSKIMTGKHLGFPELDKIAEKITGKTVQLKKHTEKNKRISKWVSLVSSCTIEEQSGFFTIELHRDLAAHLLELRSHFTQVPDWVLMAMKDAYAIRFYEIFKMHINIVRARYEKYGEDDDYREEIVGEENLGWRITRKFSLTRIHELLGIEKDSEGESYLRTDYMLGRLLPRVLKEFIRYSDFVFAFVPGKENGRAWQYITFTLRKNATPQQLELFDAWEEQKIRTRKILPTTGDESSKSVDDLFCDTDPDIIDIDPIDTTNPKPFGESNPEPIQRTEIPLDLIAKIPEDQYPGAKDEFEKVMIKHGVAGVAFYIDYLAKHHVKKPIPNWGGYLRTLETSNVYELEAEKSEALKIKTEELEAKKKAESEKKKQKIAERNVFYKENVGVFNKIEKLKEEGYQQYKEFHLFIGSQLSKSDENRFLTDSVDKIGQNYNIDRLRVRFFDDFIATINPVGYIENHGKQKIGLSGCDTSKEAIIKAKQKIYESPKNEDEDTIPLLKRVSGGEPATHKERLEKDGTSIDMEEAKQQISDLLEKSTPDQQKVLKAMFSSEKVELVSKIIDELSQPK